MIRSFQKQPQIKILPALSIDGRLRLRETELNEIARMVEGLLPQYVNGNIDITITLLEKNLKIMADIVLMKEALTHLIKNAMEAMPSGGKFSLSTNQLNCEIESLLDGDNSAIGACAFISLADTGVGIDEKIKDKIFEPFFTTKTNSKGLGLPIAYRIIKQHQGKIKVDSRVGQGTEVNIYLPLTKPEIVGMMTIPLGVSYGGIN
jgi:two-component system cell cycle sensor histidine kinase/response regulator CckA